MTISRYGQSKLKLSTNGQELTEILTVNSDKAVRDAQEAFRKDDEKRKFGDDMKLKAVIPNEVVFQIMKQENLPFNEAVKWITESPEYGSLWRKC